MKPIKTNKGNRGKGHPARTKREKNFSPLFYLPNKRSGPLSFELEEAKRKLHSSKKKK